MSSWGSGTRDEANANVVDIRWDAEGPTGYPGEWSVIAIV